MEDVFRKLESIVAEDLGGRGIGELAKASRGSLLKACTALYHSDSIVILSGFFIPPAGPETDGPPGAFSIARTLLHLNKRVIMISDESNRVVFQSLFEKEKNQNFELEIFPTPRFSDPSASSFDIHSDPVYVEYKSQCLDRIRAILVEKQVDAVVGIERLGPSVDGEYRRMKGKENSHLTAPLDLFFSEASKSEKKIHAIGVGDGGNELGMGNVLELVQEYVPLGKLIGCTTTCDDLIVAGVSNWGGYAISSGIAAIHAAILNGDKAKQEEELSLLLPNPKAESTIVKIMVDELGSVDGPSGLSVAQVDGMELAVHEAVIEKLNAVVKEALA